MISEDEHRVRKIVDSDEVTVHQIEIVVKFIDSIRRDYEAAHSYEDELHLAVLRTIAAAHSEYPGSPGDDCDLAIAALETVNLEFARYCA